MHLYRVNAHISISCYKEVVTLVSASCKNPVPPQTPERERESKGEKLFAFSEKEKKDLNCQKEVIFGRGLIKGRSGDGGRKCPLSEKLRTSSQGVLTKIAV